MKIKDKIKKKLKPGKKPGKHTERISSRTEKDRGRERTGSVPADTKNREDVYKRQLCICADVTYIKEKEQELWLVRKKMESILRQAGINSLDLSLIHILLDLTSKFDSKTLQAVQNLIHNRIYFFILQRVIVSPEGD